MARPRLDPWSRSRHRRPGPRPSCRRATDGRPHPVWPRNLHDRRAEVFLVASRLAAPDPAHRRLFGNAARRRFRVPVDPVRRVRRHVLARLERRRVDRGPAADRRPRRGGGHRRDDDDVHAARRLRHVGGVRGAGGRSALLQRRDRRQHPRGPRMGRHRGRTHADRAPERHRRRSASGRRGARGCPVRGREIARSEPARSSGPTSPLDGSRAESAATRRPAAGRGPSVEGRDRRFTRRSWPCRPRRSSTRSRRTSSCGRSCTRRSGSAGSRARGSRGRSTPATCASRGGHPRR
jgi:hypothetical protein